MLRTALIYREIWARDGLSITSVRYSIEKEALIRVFGKVWATMISVERHTFGIRSCILRESAIQYPSTYRVTFVYGVCVHNRCIAHSPFLRFLPIRALEYALAVSHHLILPCLSIFFTRISFGASERYNSETIYVFGLSSRSGCWWMMRLNARAGESRVNDRCIREHSSGRWRELTGCSCNLHAHPPRFSSTGDRRSKSWERLWVIKDVAR